MQEQTTQTKLQDYQIAIHGRIDPDFGQGLVDQVNVRWRALDEQTVLILVRADQTALRGLLSRLWDLNLAIISVNPVGMETR